MAKQAPEKYLESMCIRNAVLSAWPSLEMACIDALGVKRSGGFRMSAVLTVSEAGAKTNSSGVIKLAFVREDGKEDDYATFHLKPRTRSSIRGSRTF
jgi:hypothetical protein